MILREITNFNKTYIGEQQATKNVKFKAPFMVADGINANNRRYPFITLKKAIENYNAKIEAGKGFGGSRHPLGGHLEIPDVSHRITRIYMDGKTARVEGEILDNEKGKKILALVKSNATIGLSARGFGEIKQGKDKVNEIQPDYKMAGVDFVLEPSENIAQISQKNIFESVSVEQEPKFDVSLTEFNDLVNTAVKHMYDLSFPNANFLEEPTQKHYEKYCDEHWAEYAKIVEKELSPMTVEEPKGTEEKVQGEVYTDEQKMYDEALCAGYDRDFETFKKEILPAIETSKEEENLREEFHEYQRSGGLNDFQTFKKLREEK